MEKINKIAIIIIVIVIIFTFISSAADYMILSADNVSNSNLPLARLFASNGIIFMILMSSLVVVFIRLGLSLKNK